LSTTHDDSALSKEAATNLPNRWKRGVSVLFMKNNFVGANFQTDENSLSQMG
jgi:hypothetical protein